MGGGGGDGERGRLTYAFPEQHSLRWANANK